MLEEVIQLVKEALEGNLRSSDKATAIANAEAVKLVLQQDYPTKILDIVRPNEPEKVKAYRASVYEPIVQGDFSKIVTTLQKIRLSDGFKISFDDIDSADYLAFHSADYLAFQNYLSNEFPLTYSFENWVFNFLLQRKLTDSNALCLVYPSNFEDSQATPLPYPRIFDSKQVLIDTPDLVAVIENITNDTTVVKALTADMFFSITIPSSGSIEAVELAHNIGEIPAFKLAGILQEVEKDQPLYNSFISPCLTYWREAIRRRSDFQASMILHVNPEKWQYTNRQCKACKSKGYMNGSACDSCGGTGYELVSTPFGVHTIHPEKVSLTDASPIVTPPAGYITKPTEDIKYLGEEVKEQLYYALRAINLEFLGQEYLNQSGTAKEMDRQEVKSFLYQVAQSLVEANIKPCLKYMSGWWFGFLPSESRAELVPRVSLPKDFDILSATMLRERANELKSAQFNPSIVAQAEKEYFAKEYGKESSEYKVLAQVIDIDPLYGKIEADKQQMLLSGVIDKQTFLVSARIRDFIKQAIENNDNFPLLARSARKMIIEGMASEVISKQNINLLPVE